MAERRINMNNKVENFEWHSLLDMSGKGLHKFNAVGKDMNSQHMRNNNFNDRLINLEENKMKTIDEELKRIDMLETAFNREL